MNETLLQIWQFLYSPSTYYSGVYSLVQWATNVLWAKNKPKKKTRTHIYFIFAFLFMFILCDGSLCLFKLMASFLFCLCAFCFAMSNVWATVNRIRSQSYTEHKFSKTVDMLFRRKGLFYQLRLFISMFIVFRYDGHVIAMAER